MRNSLRPLFPALAVLLFALPARAGDIEINSPWLRATPKGASVAAGYATITNKGTVADTLVGASLPMAKVGEIHEMSMTGGVMKMRRLDKGLPIPAGKSVTLSPGGYHLMFLKPSQVLKEGETIKGELTFEKAGKITVDFPVAGLGAKAAPDAKGAGAPMQGHDMNNMGHMHDMKGM